MVNAMIIGTGIDIAEVPRIRASIERFGAKFTDRIYTDRERAYVERKANKYERYAARFAAKEAGMTCERLNLTGSPAERLADVAETGNFDLVVFDEASQCDIASALPLLYRANGLIRRVGGLGFLRGRSSAYIESHRLGLGLGLPHGGVSLPGVLVCSP